MGKCTWVDLNDPLYVEYHDNEWGKPVYEDRLLFEFLILEGAQAGLSWKTVLHKREGYRRAFFDFDVKKVASLGEKDILSLKKDAQIIRNELKIRSTITNAQAFIAIQHSHGSFSEFIWSYTDSKPIVNHWKSVAEVPATTPLSDKISKDLKKQGFKFVGSTIMYAYMQAVGMVNDHTIDCDQHPSNSTT